MIRARVSRREAQSTPYVIWNEFVRISFSDPKDLTSVQRIAHLAFLYEGEVQNGGHHQFFENKGLAHAKETLKALEELKADQHLKILRDAVTMYERTNPFERKAETVKEFIGGALEDTFRIMDTDYSRCKPDMNAILEGYLKSHFDEFVEWVP